MNINIFNIDHNKLAAWMMPTFRRKPKLLAFVRLIITPFIFLYNDFRGYRKGRLYHLMITSQKCWLERLLNDRYDFTERRIYIDDLADKPPFYIYRRAEAKPQWLSKRSEANPIHLYTRAEGGYNPDYFVVYVPVGLIFDMSEMGSLVKAYKLAGTRFKIQTY